MIYKICTSEEQLQTLVRKIVKEELHLLFPQEAPSPNEKNTPRSSKEIAKISAVVQESVAKIQSEQTEEDSWAIFGSPQPDPSKFPIQERPRALPGWSEPYRPDFENFDAPPYLPRHILN